MCPLCIATVGIMFSGAAVLMKKVRARSQEEQAACTGSGSTTATTPDAQRHPCR